MGNTSVLEIGVEELPAKLVPEILEELKSTVAEILHNNRLNYGELNVMGAPRRLAVLLSDIDEYQEELIEEIKGPAKNIAFDDKGEPTRAAEGFAASQGVEVEDLEVRKLENGEYMFAIVEHEKMKAEEVLPDVYNETINSLNLPISMRWGDYDLEFIRPIHWLLALYNDRILEFEMESVSAGNKSRGHRFLDGEEFVIQEASEYVDKLREKHVLVDPEERRNEISQGIHRIEKEYNACVEVDENLLEEVLYLVEYPTPLAGEFEEKYLNLPEPVLVTPLKEHQRYFPVREKEGDLLPLFIAVRDGGKEYIDVVREGNEKVIEARLADAEFYYERDQQRTMEERIEGLKGLVFREELGTMYDKVSRVRELSRLLGEKISLPDKLIEKLKRTARLYKTDLVSEMVREFSELQGIIGRQYAAENGEDEEVCQAIEEHYYPRYAGDRLPQGEIDCILALLDRMDTLIGCFGIGLIPSGSEDPYGLRRSAVGVVRILRDRKYNIGLLELCEAVYECYRENGHDLPRSCEETVDDVKEFLLERVNYLLSEEGISHDVLQAVVGNITDNVFMMMNCAHICAEIKNKSKFQELVTAFNRVKSIVKQNQGGDIKEKHLLKEEEKNLYSTYSQLKDKVRYPESNYDYKHNFDKLTDLIEPIHDFFENVRVMAEDSEVKENRLNLLYKVMEILSLLGDLEKIIVEEE